MAEKKQYPPKGSRCIICSVELNTNELHAWAEGRKRKGCVTCRVFLCPVCEKGRKANGT